MKKVLFLALTFLTTLSQSVRSQNKFLYKDTLPTQAVENSIDIIPPTSNISVPPAGFDCNLYNSDNPNLVLNPLFTTNSSFPGTQAAQDNAFALGYINYWRNSHGNPGIRFNSPMGGNIALMDCNVTGGKGIIGKIQSTITGHNYVLSFGWDSYFGTNNPDYNNRYFNIYLVNCYSLTNFNPNSSSYPAVPAGSQRIFCDKDFSWGPKKNTICFTANSNYDMIWIFPKKEGLPYFVTLGFYDMMLSDKSTFEIQQSYGTNTCIRTLSPSIIIPGATYQWRINGTLYSSLQTIQIDVTTQNGVISLTETGPNDPTTNTCSTNGCPLTASITITNSCSIQNELWTWMKGDNIVNQSAVYGTAGVPAVTNKPGAQTDGMSWTDLAGNFWLFGGSGYNATGVRGNLNDLWKYNISTNQWTWVKGSAQINTLSAYGTMGTPSSLNNPGGRGDGQTWIDAAGNLWLYGGWGKSTYVSYDACHSDLWKYNISNNMWTWVKGSQLPSQYPVFGSQGVSSPTNSPGCKGMAPHWLDISGNFWIFSGYNATGTEDDLWKYNVQTNQWVWVKGSHTSVPVYGTKGIPSATNTPGERYNAITWTDASGNLWLFGGEGYGTTSTYQLYNDLWRYNTSTNMWTWVSGNNLVNQVGIYGTKGVSSPTNRPGARRMATSWMDLNHGYLFLYGGQGFTDVGELGGLGDLWKYNISTNMWTWVGGSNLLNASPFYGDIGVSTLKGKPGARSGMISWREPSSGTLWLFGGMDLSANASRSGILNDLWKYNNPATGQCCLFTSNNQNSVSAKLIENAEERNSKNREDDIVNKLQPIRIEIYSTNGQLIKTVSAREEINMILYSQYKYSDLRTGLYLLRILYKDNSSKTIKKVL